MSDFLLTILKVASVFVTGLLGFVGTATEARNKETGKLTNWGKALLVGIAAATTVALVVQYLEIRREQVKTEEAGRRELEKQQSEAKRLSDLQTALLTQIGNIRLEVTFDIALEFDVDAPDPFTGAAPSRSYRRGRSDFLNYARRLVTKLTSDYGEYKTAVIRYSGLEEDEAEEDIGSIAGELGGGSSMIDDASFLPDPDREAFAHEVLNHRRISIDIYGRDDYYAASELPAWRLESKPAIHCDSDLTDQNPGEFPNDHPIKLGYCFVPSKTIALQVARNLTCKNRGDTGEMQTLSDLNNAVMEVWVHNIPEEVRDLITIRSVSISFSQSYGRRVRFTYSKADEKEANGEKPYMEEGEYKGIAYYVCHFGKL